MDVTAANIRREYRTPRTLWVQVLISAAAFLAVMETARQLMARGYTWRAAGGAALLVAVAGWFAAVAAGRAVRRGSFHAELWRKFGLGRELLDAVAAVPPLPDDAARALDDSLRSVRTLAALEDHDTWAGEGVPQPAGLTDQAEAALLACLRRRPPDGAALALLAGVLRETAGSLTAALAAAQRGEAEELAAAWERVEAGRAALAGDPGA